MQLLEITSEIDATKLHEYLHNFLNPLITLTFLKI
jgi:hypothetical protein